MRNYIVALDPSATVALRDEITRYFQANGNLFWHWLENLWLIKDSDFSSAQELYGSLRVSCPSLGDDVLLVIETGQVTSELTHFGVSSLDSWRWLGAHWGSPG